MTNLNNNQIIEKACNILNISIKHTKKELISKFKEFEFAYCDDKRNKDFNRIKKAYLFLRNKMIEDENKWEDEYNDRIKYENKLDYNEKGDSFINKYGIMQNFKGDIYFHKDTHWFKTSKEYLEKYCYEFDDKESSTINTRFNILKNILLKTTIEDIDWNVRLQNEEIPFLNGLLNIDNGEIKKHDKENYINYVIPHNYDSSKICPTWEECLFEWFGNDINKISLLQEYFGYMLSNDLRFEKYLHIEGNYDTEREELINTILALLGRNNISIINNFSFNSKELSRLCNYRINIISNFKDVDTFSWDMKSIFNNKILDIDQKYMTEPPIRRFSKKIINSAVKVNITLENLMLLKLERKVDIFYKYRGNLSRYLEENEIQGIINWAIEGLKRLQLNEKFTTI